MTDPNFVVGVGAQAVHPEASRLDLILLFHLPQRLRAEP